MSRNRKEMIREAKEANVREKRKLSLKIEGYGGINANYRIQAKETEKECVSIRRELAKSLLEEARYKRESIREKKEGKRTTFRSSATVEDPTKELRKKQDEVKKQKNGKLLRKTKENEKHISSKVKDFVLKMDIKENKSNEILTIDHDDDSDKEDDKKSFFSETPEEAWMAARKTRYVRTRILRDFEIELSPNEIFGSK